MGAIAADSSVRFRTPDVNVRANGRSGYDVVFHDVDGSPMELRTFRFTQSVIDNRMISAEEKAQHRSQVREAAYAYRDGVAEGIYRASFMLGRIVGAS